MAAGLAAQSEETSHPWVIVRAQERCARVESSDPSFTVEGLLAREGCERERIDGREDVAVIDCDALWEGKGFVLTETQEMCEHLLSEVVRREAANAADD